MSSSDLHEAFFKWPHSEPTDVIVTGSFDGWSQTIHLSRIPYGFAATVKIPWGQKVAYKYIVDGRWTTTDTQPTELDPMGNINNVYNAPARPAQPQAEAPRIVLPPAAIATTPIKSEGNTGNVTNGVITTAKQAATSIVEAIAPGTTEQSHPVPTPTGPIIADSTAAVVMNAASAVTESTTSGVTAAISAVSAAVAAATGATPKGEYSAEQTAHESELTSAPDSEHHAERDVSPQSVLPSSAATDPVAPIVPVPVLPLSADADCPTVNGELSSKTTEIAVAGNAVTSDDAPTTPPKDVSTHTPVIINGQATTEESTAVGLPPVTPIEIPTAATTDGTANGAESAPVPASNNGDSHQAKLAVPPASPAVSPARAASQNGHHKEKRLFPTLGRGHRHSSSGSHSEFGEHGSETSSASNTVSSRRKQRKSSFFGKIKELFHHEHHKAKAEN